MPLWSSRPLESKNPKTRLRAVEKLGKKGNAEAVGQLGLLIKDRDKDVRVAVAKALGKIGTLGAIVGLALALHDEDESVRQTAARALENIGGPQAEQALAKYRARHG